MRQRAAEKVAAMGGGMGGRMGGGMGHSNSARAAQLIGSPAVRPVGGRSPVSRVVIDASLGQSPVLSQSAVTASPRAADCAASGTGRAASSVGMGGDSCSEVLNNF